MKSTHEAVLILLAYDFTDVLIFTDALIPSVFLPHKIALITCYTNTKNGVLMKYLLLIALFISPTFSAVSEEVDLEQFAQHYYKVMSATQAPNATAVELEEYLSLLTDDIGHSHLPYVVDDSRLPDGKASMRKGMTFYLGAHTKYETTLLNVFVFNKSAIAIRYKNYAKGIHPQNKQPIEYSQTMMEVLEMEGDKVAVIRKYHE
jgi:hypothetical protein